VYRPDIEGLRAIAITLVVIYHAFPKYLPGGFIGVDIFFVISGFLISKIIIKQTETGNFLYLDFYSRRVKRIFPALLLVLFFTLYTVSTLSQKDQLKLTLGTLKASTVFGANIEVLTYKKGYFDAELRVNPLLHLWSLGV
jgi:peptidoglycan/LPS O-acetylase OafA/YrhL